MNRLPRPLEKDVRKKCPKKYVFQKVRLNMGAVKKFLGRLRPRKAEVKGERDVGGRRVQCGMRRGRAGRPTKYKINILCVFIARESSEQFRNSNFESCVCSNLSGLG